MFKQLLAAIAMILGGPTTLLAAPPGNAKVTAALIADTGKIQAGKPFTVGMRLTITPHWHIYWKNAGESGLPTTVTLKLPDGFTASPWQYPAPSIFDLGGVQSYGYQDEVTLTATVTPPPTLTDSPAPIEATVKFLVCSSVCLPGKLTVPLALGGDENTAVIRESQKHIPQKTADAVNWKTTTTDDGWTHMQFDTDNSGAQWFANPPEGVLIRNAKVDGKTVSFDTKKQGGSDVKEKSFESVLAYVDYTTEHGVRRGVVIDVPTPP